MPAFAMPALALRAEPVVWNHHPVNVYIDKLREGKKPATNFPINVQFAVDWDFQQGRGNASVASVDGVKVDQSKRDLVASNMIPLGVLGQLDFMSHDPHWITLEDGNKFYAYRVLLNMKDEKHNYADISAAIMVGPEGDDIITSQNYGAGEDKQ